MHPLMLSKFADDCNKHKGKLDKMAEFLGNVKEVCYYKTPSHPVVTFECREYKFHHMLKKLDI